jgi:AraC-like DNA-binding protein
MPEIVNKKETLSLEESNEVLMSTDCPQTFPMHWHTFAEFILLNEDCCSYGIQNEIYEAGTNDILLVWPTQLHSTIHTPPKASVILQFSSSLITGCPDIYINYRQLQQLHKIRKNEYPDLNAILVKYIQRSWDYFSEKGPFMETEVKICVLQILLALSNHILNNSKDDNLKSGQFNAVQKKVRQACAYIDENCDKDLSQVSVANYVGLSQYYFSRVFKENTSLSFSNYIAQKRIHNAIYLLSSDELSITEIAYQSGFQSISNFNQIFRKVMNCSPKKYREMFDMNRNGHI